MKITAKDIARRVGVSPATVSMVFRQRPGISEEVRTQVLAAAQELGFVYTGTGGARQPRILQFIIYKRHGKVVADTPFFEQLTKGVSDSVHALGYQLSITYFYGAENVDEQLRTIKSSRCVGIILLATEMHTHDMDIFDSLGVPIVLLDNWFPSKRYDAVVIDNQRGALRATQYLIQCGHTRLGYLSSKVDIRNFVERREGYLSAIRALKDPTNDSTQRIIRVGTSIDTAQQDMAAYLATDPVLPTAFFADNDNIAIGCLRALLRAGCRIPEEVSIIGFDDMPICEVAEPQLTTMAVPKGRMGALAVERLDRLICGGTGGEVIRISVQPEIVPRSSVLPRNRG
ncbi:MAG: LacI family DNA-binding transcriptional regulator [Gemmiger sp.]|nr:LacI family DNA-binding transcriptional regulator [Gemmiger sp.]